MPDITSEQLAAMSEDQLYAQLGAIQIASKHAMLSSLNLQNEALTFAGETLQIPENPFLAISIRPPTTSFAAATQTRTVCLIC